MLEAESLSLSRVEILRAEHLVKTYAVGTGFRKGGQRSVKAVAGVSFMVTQGETIAIVGESGCGKSTIGRLLLGLELPTSGRILRQPGGRAQDVVDSEDRPVVQAVFQNPWASLNPRHRIGRIVGEPLTTRSPWLSWRRASLREPVLAALNQVGLSSDIFERFPHELSGGQRQRVAIAAALISRPDVIVLDEPTSSVDVSTQAQLMNLFMALQHEFGMSYVLISHSLGVVRFLSQHVLVMYLGQIVESGTTRDVLSSPSHPYTRALLAAELSGRPSERKARRTLVKGEPPSPIDLPSGCAFHPRCPWAQEVCVVEAPAAHEFIGRTVACHFALEINEGRPEN